MCAARWQITVGAVREGCTLDRVDVVDFRFGTAAIRCRVRVLLDFTLRGSGGAAFFPAFVFLPFAALCADDVAVAVEHG